MESRLAQTANSRSRFLLIEISDCFLFIEALFTGLSNRIVPGRVVGGGGEAFWPLPELACVSVPIEINDRQRVKNIEGCIHDLVPQGCGLLVLDWLSNFSKWVDDRDFTQCLRS